MKKEEKILIDTKYPELAAVIMQLQAISSIANDKDLTLNELSFNKTSNKNSEDLTINISFKRIKQ
ncbi:hypothetical protein F5ESL0233_05200 [Lactobacillus sp. ESL0233]|uniref:hypothetical protein n=1 Tax=Lactobacillus sp. ESL0233 TaxID=2069354 RepID=UPI000EFC6D75|nr:hypothetical protein [Lactobacillus sp. ESL0233]RMC41715.1 hypothetical protein F5ESL0233_05200 [Lactobacillus sp. ESL0233]